MKVLIQEGKQGKAVSADVVLVKAGHRKAEIPLASWMSRTYVLSSLVSDISLPPMAKFHQTYFTVEFIKVRVDKKKEVIYFRT